MKLVRLNAGCLEDIWDAEAIQKRRLNRLLIWFQVYQIKRWRGQIPLNGKWLRSRERMKHRISVITIKMRRGA